MLIHFEIISIVIISLIFITHCKADEQFNCPNNGSPKLEFDGKPVQCLPGQSSELICGQGYSCFFSGFNYQCCPTNTNDEQHHSHDHKHHDDKNSHDNQSEPNAEELNNNAECPDDTFIVLTWKGVPIPCNPRTNPCPEKNMFCNKYSPVPVCCESINTKYSSLPAPTSKLNDNTIASLPLIPTSLEVNNLQKAQLAPSTIIHKDKVDEKASTNANVSNNGFIASSNIQTTTIVNHDMNMHGECTANSVLVFAETGQPIKCSRNRPCPLESLLCHKSNNGKSYCCQIVPRDEIQRLNEPSTSKDLNKSQQISQELKQLSNELAQSKTLSAQISQEKTDKSSSLISKSQTSLAIEKGQAPSIQPPISFDKISDGFADNELDSFNNSKSDIIGGIASIHVIAHAAKTQYDSNGINSEKEEIENVNQKLAGISKETPSSAVEYRPHNQGGYAVLKRGGQYARDHRQPNVKNAGVISEERRRLAQRFLLDQIKDGWPYDEKFYHSENVIVVNQGRHPATIVHFPN